MGLFKKLFNKQTKAEGVRPTALSPPPPPAAPEPLQITEVTPADLVAMLQAGEPITIVDLRQVWEYSSGHIPGAVSIPMLQLPGKLDEIPKNRKVVMQCYHGITSLDAAGYLIQKGWDAANVASLSGGMSGWVATQGIEALEQAKP
jgi:rhodanese-related sulfurtransferase